MARIASIISLGTAGAQQAHAGLVVGRDRRQRLVDLMRQSHQRLSGPVGLNDFQQATLQGVQFAFHLQTLGNIPVKSTVTEQPAPRRQNLDRMALQGHR